MICGACGHQNGPSRRTCKNCHGNLADQVTDQQAPAPHQDANLTVKIPAAPTGTDSSRTFPAIRSQEQAIELLRVGTNDERIGARYFLTDLFESRGMRSEAIELLEANGRAGVRDRILFSRLATLYRKVGRDDDADAALAEAASLAVTEAPGSAAPAWRAPSPAAQVHQAPPPPTYYQPAAPQPIHVTVNPQMTNHTVVHNVVNVRSGQQSPPMIVRLIYLLLIGWWFGFFWLLCALFLFVPIITIPLALWMLYKTPKAFFL